MMENIKNIQIIKKSFDQERKKYLYEITKVNNLIAKREATIRKISAYQNEYTNKDNLVLSRTIPTLSRNIDLFTGKIADIIEIEKIEIQKLERMKVSMVTKIGNIDHKIKLMNHFEERAKLEKAVQVEKSDQRELDDLASTAHLRGDHE